MKQECLALARTAIVRVTEVHGHSPTTAHSTNTVLVVLTFAHLFTEDAERNGDDQRRNSETVAKGRASQEQQKVWESNL